MSVLLGAFGLEPAQALAFLRQKGYATSWNWYDTRREAHARAFTVAKVMRLDILQDIRQMLDNAIEGELTTDSNGDQVKRALTFEQFKKRLKPMLQKKGWWGEKEMVNPKTGEVETVQLGSTRRLRTIYQTNVQTAYMAGRYQQEMEVAAARPFRQYLSVVDGATTDRCRSLHLTVYPVDDQIWDTLFPPNHWNCRSRTRTMSQKQLDRKGLNVYRTKPDDFREKTTRLGPRDSGVDVTVRGVRVQTADGQPITYWPDAGWDYNPGKAAYQPNLDRYDYDIAQKYVRGVVTGPDFERFVAAKGKIPGFHPVAVIDNDMKRVLKTKSQTVILSDDSLKKIVVDDHQDVELSDLQQIPDVIEKAGFICLQKDMRICIINESNRFYYAVVKVTRDGNELFLHTFFKAQMRDVERLRRRAKAGEVEIVRDTIRLK